MRRPCKRDRNPTSPSLRTHNFQLEPNSKLHIKNFQLKASDPKTKFATQNSNRSLVPSSFRNRLPQLTKVPLKWNPRTEHMAAEQSPRIVVPNEETPGPEASLIKLQLSLAQFQLNPFLQLIQDGPTCISLTREHDILLIRLLLNNF